MTLSNLSGGPCGPPNPLADSLAVLDDDVDVLEKSDVGQNVSAHGDDVRVTAGRERAEVLVSLEPKGRPSGRAGDRLHRRHPQTHPGIELSPGGVRMEVARDAR